MELSFQYSVILSGICNFQNVCLISCMNSYNKVNGLPMAICFSYQSLTAIQRVEPLLTYLHRQYRSWFSWPLLGYLHDYFLAISQTCVFMHRVKQLMYTTKESKAPTLGEPDILRVCKSCLGFVFQVSGDTGKSGPGQQELEIRQFSSPKHNSHLTVNNTVVFKICCIIEII